VVLVAAACCLGDVKSCDTSSSNFCDVLLFLTYEPGWYRHTDGRTDVYAMRNVNVQYTDVVAPGAPRDVIITWYNATSVRLQWAPPRQTNGRLDFYQLQYYDSSSSFIGLFMLCFLACVISTTYHNCVLELYAVRDQ